MLQTWFIVAVSAGYLGLLFAVAFYGDRRADSGRSIINNATVYALSFAVYVTSWTYYGSVGWAATAGVGFLPIYLGPTLMLALGWLVLRRIIRISHRHRVTSLADFVSARYGKSTALGCLVTIIAVVGVVPYIALQLKAVSNTFSIIRRHPGITSVAGSSHVPLFQDTGLYVALVLAAFTIVFGTRHLDATERHEGMVAAIAFESVVKLVVFLSVGIFVTFWMFGGVHHLFSQAADAGLTTLFTVGEQTGYGTWIWLTVLSMLAIVLLPRQWQISVVENVDERHLKRAMWLFPLYLLAISLFVLPIAAGGLLRFGKAADADTYVLTLPMAEGHQALALLVFIGGLSAATSMVIVETIALSTMVSNSLVLPLLLRSKSRLAHRDHLAGLVLGIRRATIVLVLLLGYAYFRLAGEQERLVSIGLVSFAAVAQFAPAILGGLFWKGGTRRGVLAGLVAGFAVWTYTLVLPSFADAGLLSASFLGKGPLGIGLLRPQHLFDLGGMDPISHGMFWSALLNLGGYVAVSLADRPGAAERAQAVQFVEILEEPVSERRWQVRATVGELQSLLERFLGREGAQRALGSYPGRRPDSPAAKAPPELVHHAEAQLAGSVGAASARLALAAVAGEEEVGTDEVMKMIGEASQRVELVRRRLKLLYDATGGIGTTLDVTRTAEELTQVVVPRFADYVTVDLAESVLGDEEPGMNDVSTGSKRMRRVAVSGIRDDAPFVAVGDLIAFVPSSPQARSIESGQAVLVPRLRDATGWQAVDPERALRIIDYGIHSLITAPLSARGVLLGVVYFWRSEKPEPFEQDDLFLAAELATRAAVSLDNARRYTREHGMAVALQRRLLPRALPEQSAVEVASRYLPAQEGVGGDWFDVIPLPGARVALVMGDIVGHGLHAAATMGQLRTAVHNFSTPLDLPPDELLSHLDELVTLIDQDAIAAGDKTTVTGATCLYAVYDSVSGHCAIASAGHPPPALVHPDGTVEFLEVASCLPLGIGGLPFESAEFRLTEGSRLVLFTDGLVERRDLDLDIGLRMLRETLAHADQSPEETCDAVLDALLPEVQRDDIALLVARTHILGAGQVAEWDVEPDPAAVRRARAAVSARLREWELEDLVDTTELICSELITNAMRYGAGPIKARLIFDRALVCEVSDHSSTSPHMRYAASTDEGGRGLFLVAQFAERWGTRYTKDGKVIWAEQAVPGTLGG
ncbi:SpoIIE family protein phosphatase [Streptomyces sp. NK08204]|uniref:SpoIIE family protein phosphatase n=1 Tax=Streptomyces sp. NK08204 TaxID=2873260 RepID=UPI0027E31B7D|nr:SpoIIE family protein phosphatase [Streptomyces sp. NK08204]